MGKRKVNASPTKDFFVNMITRDISLEDCILDLIDNCIDGARRQIGEVAITVPTPTTYRRFRCDIHLSSRRFVINDNCGGIPTSIARNYAFRFGRDPAVSLDDYSIGLYGIGMKRAIFKLGHKIEIKSQTTTSAFHMPINVDDWLEEPGSDWFFNLYESDVSGRPGTTIRVEQLQEATAEQFGAPEFENRLCRIIERDYAFFLERGFHLRVNSRRLRPMSLELGEGSDFAPARFVYDDEEGVEVEIIAGMAAAPSDDEEPSEKGEKRSDPYGWSILCNDRTILAADKTERTIWGYGGVAGWHPQYNGFLGLALFRSKDPKKLPWTTTKRDIDQSSGVYRRALAKMRAVTLIWTSYTNRRKADLQAAKKKERSAKKVRVLRVKKSTSLRVPNLKVPKKHFVNILYQKPKEEVDRAKEALGNVNLSAAGVGVKTFEYFYTREVDE